MKILIVDDDFNVHNILTMIIEHEKIGQVIENKNLTGVGVFNLIASEKPDIIIIDLLMPGKDGIELMKEIKSKYPSIRFIMLSQVTSKAMIEKAYDSGIEFFINKPINAIEVKSVLYKVINDIKMREKLNKIQHIFESNVIEESSSENKISIEDKLREVMKRIGILGESGEEDIIKALGYMVDHEGVLDKCTLSEFFKKLSPKAKSTEQRIRRTAFVAMNNIANLGVEDYMNETFTEFSTSLFAFDDIKKEMDFIRGKSEERGKVNVKKFLQGILYYISR